LCEGPTGRRGTSHGLRKLCLTRLAEVGCTVFEIMAVSGHKQVEEVQRYVEAANRKKLALAASAKQFGIVLKGATAAEMAEELEAFHAGQVAEMA